MVDDRIDIVVTDKISTGPAKKLRDIAKFAVKADTSITKLKTNLSGLDSSAFVKMTTASSRLSAAQAKEASAQVRLTTARSRSVAETHKAALASQRLATEQARTASATERAAISATHARTALTTEAAASDRLSAAKRRETVATATNTTAKQRNAAASRGMMGNSRRLRGIVQNTSFQLQDIAVQMQMGTRTSIVLGQQLPQLAGGFGAVGAAIGVLLAVGIPLVAYLLPSLGIGAKDAGELQEDLADAINKVVASAALARTPVQELSETYGGSVGHVRNYVAALVDLRNQQAANAMQASALKLQENDYLNAVSDGVRALDNVRKAYDKNAAAALRVANVEESAIAGVAEAYRQYKAAITLEDQVREQQEFIEVLNQTGLSGQANLNKITQALAMVGDQYAALNAHTRAQLADLDLTETQIRRVSAAVEDFQAAKTFSDGAEAAQELRTMLTDMGVDFDNDLIPSLIEFEGVARTAFASGGAGARSMAADVSKIAQEARNAMSAMDDLRNSAITENTVATINLEFRTDPVGRAKALAEARALHEQAPLREGASPLDLVGLDGQIRVIGDAAAATAGLNEERKRLNDLDREANSSAGGAVDVRKAATDELKNLTKQLMEVDALLIASPFSDEAAIDAVRLAEQERINIVMEAHEMRIINEQETADRILAINQQAAQDIQELEAARNSMILMGASDTFASLADAAAGFAGEQSGIYKAMFIASKAFAIADSIMKIQQGVANAMALPFPANLAAAGVVAANAASIVSNIQAVQFKKDGGEIFGEGGPRDDKVPIMASNKEFIVNARDAQRNLPLLRAMNAGRDINTARPAFRDGGEIQQAFRAPMPNLVGNNANNAPNSQSNKTTVNVFTRDADTRIEVTDTQMGAIGARSLSRGQRNL